MKNIPLLVLICAFHAVGIAQEKKAGPIVKDYGKVWVVADQDYTIAKDTELKVVFDIMYSPENPSSLNTSIETAARFLNMHAQHGVSLDKMKVALVVHNKASKDICTNEAYYDRFGVENPNAEMIDQLLDVGVQFIFCGQSSKSRDFPIEETIDGIQLSLSAMTALIQLQNDGYRLIKF